MIDAISGLVTSLEDHRAVVRTGPISLGVYVPVIARYSVGDTVSLVTFMHWHNEQGPSLFGFENTFERTIFLLIIDCSGVGPKLGLAVLEHIGAQRFLEVISSGDGQALAHVPGIGAKKAEHIIVHLKHKVTKLIQSGAVIPDTSNIRVLQETAQALEALHYNRTEIQTAIAHISQRSKDAPDKQITFDQVLRQALAFLAKHTRV